MSQLMEDSTIEASSHDSKELFSTHLDASSSNFPLLSSSLSFTKESNLHSNYHSEFTLSHSVASEPFPSYFAKTSHLSLFPSSTVAELPLPSHTPLGSLLHSKQDTSNQTKDDEKGEEKDNKEEKEKEKEKENQDLLTAPPSPSFTQISFETYLFQTEPSLCSWTQLDIASSNSATPISSRRTTMEWTQSDNEEEWNLSSTFLPTYTPDTSMELPSIVSSDSNLPSSSSSWASWGLSKLVYFLESMSIPDLESNYLSSSFTQDSPLTTGNHHDACCMKSKTEDLYAILHDDDDDEEEEDVMNTGEQAYLPTLTWVHCNSA